MKWTVVALCGIGFLCAACERRSTAEKRDVVAVAAVRGDTVDDPAKPAVQAAPPRNVVSAYARNLKDSADKAKATAAQANKVVENTNRELQQIQTE